MKRNSFIPYEEFPKSIGGENQSVNKDSRAIHYSYNLTTSEEAGRRYSGFLDPLTRGKKDDSSFGSERRNGFRKQSLPVIKTDCNNRDRIKLATDNDSSESHPGKPQEVTSLQQQRKISLTSLKHQDRRGLKSQISEPKTKIEYRNTQGYYQPYRCDQKVNANSLASKSFSSLYSELPGLGWRFKTAKETTQNANLTTARKTGLSALENKELMHRKMRKKAVVDTTDDAHYQRQFLRILNKRF